jgi:prevent-host-death family protein
MIRPVSDLRNNFADISKYVHETDKPVFLTKNGRGSMVVMSMEAFEQKQFDEMIYQSLREADIEARTTKKRFTTEEVFKSARKAAGLK